ncbi:MAG: adenosylcobinamide-phosphate synthase CbiB [Candidatus Methanoplasma sp.]|jgi:adenosylcobinamide-phosphate synthase|nr:adenosylcobinamide-phosphate synthase CbiB [Candidatus Methanoplasma sp.]
MEPWLSAVLIVAVSLLIDRFVGELPNRYHLLRWIGNVVDFLDGRVRNRASGMTRVIGFLSYAAVFLMFWFAMMLICSLVRNGLGQYQWEVVGISMTLGEIMWIFVLAFMFKITFAVFSFRKHCKPIEDDLAYGDIPAARGKVQMIVSRDTGGLDKEHISSACCETISENLVDSAISPTFYFGLLGLTGAIMFRCANLMDAMWGYLNDKYARLGFFAARFDDILGYPTARISPLFVSMAAWMFGYDHKGVIAAAKEEHSKTPSPNSGWPMVSVAHAMGISMEKEGVYVMGKGDMPSVDDISRCYRLVERTSVLFMIIVTMPLFAFIGIQIQITVEDAILGLAGVMI